MARPAKRKPLTVAAEVACIERGKCYPLPVFMRLARMGRHAMRTARRNGLRVIYVGAGAYVTGDSWFQYLDTIDRGETSAA